MEPVSERKIGRDSGRPGQPCGTWVVPEGREKRWRARGEERGPDQGGGAGGIGAEVRLKERKGQGRGDQGTDKGGCGEGLVQDCTVGI